MRIISKRQSSKKNRITELFLILKIEKAAQNTHFVFIFSTANKRKNARNPIANFCKYL